MISIDNQINNASRKYTLLAITKTIDNKLLSGMSIKDFLDENPDLNTFFSNNKSLYNILNEHGTTITNDDYNNIIKDIINKYYNKIPINNTQSIPNDNLVDNSNVVYLNNRVNTLSSTDYINKTKKKIFNNKSGYMDALLLAFIVGAFIGVLFINLYARILQTI